MLKNFEKESPWRVEIVVPAWQVLEVKSLSQVGSKQWGVGRTRPDASQRLCGFCLPGAQPLWLSALLGQPLTPDPWAICFGDAGQALVHSVELDPGILSELSRK